ncbi:hypothetical protein DFR67_11621 [Williamsia limnetica]|uniref:Sigma-70-like protein n=1 Tax=Williamsia limnetica TaxID=882452 RepID=A0A318RIN4_WILLI|nr:hypothetical protein DFR67_11621 [Williamsia limnetica]
MLRAQDLHKMAWHMHYDEHMSWEQIATELEEPLAAVEKMAAAYAHHTDALAADRQHTLF